MDIGPIIMFSIIIPILIISIIVIASRTSNPFKFLYKRIYFNVSRNKSPIIKDYLDNYLIEHKMFPIEAHMEEYGLLKESDFCISKNMLKN